jgi:beta-1,4-N-acetylglucosaminyltransferase
MEKIKIGIITSNGGHLFQLYQLKKWWSKYPHFWVTNKGKDTDFFLKKEKVFYGFFPEQRNLTNAIKNFFLAWKILIKEKPQILISCGAGIAPPFFLVGKILGCKLIYIESYDFIKYPTLSAKIISHFTNLMLVQHSCQKKFFKNAKYWGKTL